MRITISLVAICFIVFILQLVFGNWFTLSFALIPALAVDGFYWQFLTYMFLHGGLTHIVINMMVLFIFGPMVERELSWKLYLFLFLVAGIGSALFHILLAGFSDLTPMLGASGAVFGILTAYAVLFPKTRLIIFPIPIPIPAIIAVGLIVVFELFAGFLGIISSIAHFGHVGGILVGAIFMLLLKRKKPKREFEFFWE